MSAIAASSDSSIDRLLNHTYDDFIKAGAMLAIAVDAILRRHRRSWRAHSRPGWTNSVARRIVN
jgi:hypothetical protein